MIDAQPITNGFNGLTDLGWFKLFGFEFDPYDVADLLPDGRLACRSCSSPRMLLMKPAPA